jgi:hypothetical protein
MGPFLLNCYFGGLKMKGQFAPKILFVTGITMLVTLPIMPSSSVVSAANGADGANVITHELKKAPSNQAKEEEKSTSWNWFKKEEESDNNVPVQRQKNQERATGICWAATRLSS